MLPIRMLGPLMLLSVLQDSSAEYSACPLTLDPPELVQKLGQLIVVNCTTPVDGHTGIIWKYDKNKTKFEDVETFNELKVAIEWDLQAQCSIKFNDSYVCSKDLPITVYKIPSRITVISDGPALEETIHELQCEIDGVAPVQNLTVTWYKNKKNMKTEHFNLTASTPTNVSSALEWRVTREDDGALITCEVLLDLGKHEDPLVSNNTLSVLYIPTIKSCPTDVAGKENEFTLDTVPCVADGNPKPDIHWYHKDTLINASKPLTRRESGKYTAHVDNIIGSSNTTVDITIEYAPIFQDKAEHIFLNKSGNVSLHCEAQGNPPPLYNWTKDGVTVAVNTQNLNVSHVNENITYDCLSSNHMGYDWKKFNITVMETTTKAHDATTQDAANEIGCPLTITPDEIFVQYGDSSLANCSTSLKDAGGIGWEATTGGISLTKVTHLPWRVDKVEVWTISAGCFINLNDGSQCEKPINVTIYKTPDCVWVSPIGSDEMVEGRPQQLKCEIINVAPVGKLQVTWYRGHVLLHTEMFNASEVAPKNVSSILTVTPEKVHNGANFTCEAHLLLGQKGPNAKVISAAYTAAVQYLPTFTKGNISKEFSPGENVTLDCSAEGNPLPELQWKYPPAANVKNDTRGRQININITGATSSNVGVYSCGATNKVGTVSRTVTLNMKEKTNSVNRLVLLVVLSIFFLVLIIVGVVCYRNYKRKQGHYTVVGLSDSIPLRSSAVSVM